jgi:hypothetical protein
MPNSDVFVRKIWESLALKLILEAKHNSCREIGVYKIECSEYKHLTASNKILRENKA